MPGPLVPIAAHAYDDYDVDALLFGLTASSALPHCVRRHGDLDLGVSRQLLDADWALLSRRKRLVCFSASYDKTRTVDFRIIFRKHHETSGTCLPC